MGRPSLLELSPRALAAWCHDHAQPPYRAQQIRRWLFARRADRVDPMTDLPKTLRDALNTEFELFTGEVVAHRVATDGTEKLVLRFGEGEEI